MREEAREEDGKRDRGEMREAIARWTPEGRVYFDNRYHRRRCYRLSYRSAPHTVNRQQIESCVCVFSIYIYINTSFHDASVYSSSVLTPDSSSPSPFRFLFTLHLSFSC